MPRISLRWSPLATMAGLLLTVGALTGCPGSLDPSLMGEPPMTGAGGTTGSGGSMGSGGGGTNANCTGDNDGAMIVTSQCAAVCHNPGAAPVLGGGLDLTVDSNIKTRLVGVKSPTTASGQSLCNGNSTAYLNAGSNPATGLLIDKVQKSKPQLECGEQMPLGGPYLSSLQQQCLTQWATTLTTGTQ